MLQLEASFDRGDGPAQAVLQENARAQALRKAEETQQELMKIKERVTSTLTSFELGEKLREENEADATKMKEAFMKQEAKLEFVDDLNMLVAIIADPVAKRKYQQQVTIFIVGYENLCGRREKLLVQLNEFFVHNSQDDEVFELEIPEFDMDEVGEIVRGALDKAEQATERLATISKDVMKALEHANPKESKKSKKKLEKTLQQSQNDIMALTEKLLNVQTELEENEGKLSQMYKSLELKNIEVERYKAQVETAKRNSHSVEELKDELAAKELQIQKNNSYIHELELNLAQAEDKQERDYDRNRKVKDDMSKMKEQFEEQVQEQQQHVIEVRAELEKQYDEKIISLKQEHEAEIQQIKEQHANEMSSAIRSLESKMKKREAEIRTDAERRASTVDQASRTQSRARTSIFSPDSSSEGEYAGTSPRPSLKASAQAIRAAALAASSGSRKSVSNTPSESVTPATDASSPAKSAAPPTPAIVTPKTEPDKAKVQTADVGVQSDVDSSDPEAPAKPIAVVQPMRTPPEADVAIEEEKFEWHAYPPEVLSEKFQVYRVKNDSAMNQLQEEVAGLKNQLTELSSVFENELDMHKLQWAEERSTLAKEFEEAKRLQGVAEREAEDAVLQLEELLAEQEEMRLAKERSLLNKTEEYTMTGPSLYGDTQSQRSPSAGSQASAKSRQQSALSQHSSGRSKPPSEGSRKSSGVSRDPSIHEFPGEEQELELEEVKAEEDGVPPVDSGVMMKEDTSFSLTVSDENGHVLSPENTMTSLSPPLRQRPVMSARARRRLMNSALKDHPVALETTRMLTSVHEFKEWFVMWLTEQGLEEEAEAITRIDSVVIDGDDQVGVIEALPQIRRHISEVMEQTQDTLAQKNLRDAGYETGEDLPEEVQEPDDNNNVTETEDIGVGDHIDTRSEGTQWSYKRKSADHAGHVVETRNEGTQMSVKSAKSVRSERSGKSSRHGSARGESAADKQTLEGSYVKLLQDFNNLAEVHDGLKRQHEEDGRFYQEQVSQNAAVMSEMQEVIDHLRVQLNELQRKKSESQVSQRVSSAIMFTRLDAERNSKIMHKAVNDGRISADSFEDVVSQMDEYCNLPAKRLIYLVQRYKHHMAMNDIETNIRKSKSLNDDVFSLLDKMEVLQNQRARRWANTMDELSDERDRLANLLMNTIDVVEKQSGIFLIKPMYSYQGKGKSKVGPIVTKRPKSQMDSVQAHPSGPMTPTTSPWMAVTSLKGEQMRHAPPMRPVPSIPAMAKLESMPLTVGAMETSVEAPGAVWQMSKSQPSGTPANIPLTTPRILEMDINRMMIGQTQISAKSPLMKPDGTSPTARSYVTVERPSGSRQIKKAKKPSDGRSSVNSPPPTPLDGKHHTRARSVPSTLSHSSPLPPIRMPDVPDNSKYTSYSAGNNKTTPSSSVYSPSIPPMTPMMMDKAGEMASSPIPERKQEQPSPPLTPDMMFAAS